MAYTQIYINNIVDEIVSQYNNQRVAYFGSFPGESVVPIMYYVDKLRGTTPAPAMANDRADGWGTNFPITLTSLFTHEIYKDKRYPKGTILVWNTPHIAIVTNSDGSNTVTVFEQSNGLPCSIRDRVLNDHQYICTYALVPIINASVHTLPKGALKMPTNTNKYYICKSILGFSAYSQAVKHENATGVVSQGNYFIFRETSGMLNLTKLQGYAGYWINPADNVVS